jgi:hypothetical protein
MNVILKVVFNIKTVQVKDIQHYPYTFFLFILTKVNKKFGI